MTPAVPPGFAYHPGFLSESECEAVLHAVAGLRFEHELYRGHRLKRGYVQFGYTYVTAGRKVAPAAPLPPFLTEILTKLAAYCPDHFDQCIVTHYPKDAKIGWHPDAPCFGDRIAAVSLGNAATLQFRPNGDAAVSYEVVAEPGSLYLLSGPARWEYQHQVPAVKSERFSLTFRTVVRSHGGSRKAKRV